MSMTHDEMIVVIAAHRDGKEIEARHRRSINPAWQPFTKDENPHWDTWTWDYRIKPEPRLPRDFWAVYAPNHKAPLRVTRAEAEGDAAMYSNPAAVIHVREVLE